MFHEFKNKLAFTLIELIIVLAIISILATIIVLIINPANIFANSRNSSRATDVGSFQSAILRYLAESPINGTSRDVSDLAGYTQLLTSAQNGTGGNCPGGASGVNSSNTPSTVFNIDNTNGSILTNTLDISKLLNGGYLAKVPKDPLNQTDYQACFDSYAGNPLIIYSPQTENKPTLYSSIIGTVQAFTPSFISGLTIQLDSTQLQGATNNQQISSWNDLSGKGNNATQATVLNQPTFKSDSVTLSGKPGVLNDGSNSMLNFTGNPLGGTAYTIFYLGNVTNNNGNVIYAAGDYLQLRGDSGGSWLFRNGGSYIYLSTVNNFTTVPHLLSLVFDQSATNTAVSYSNGVQISFTSSALNSMSNLSLGRSGADSAGFTYTFIAYNRALNNVERQTVENYINQKFSVY